MRGSSSRASRQRKWAESRGHTASAAREKEPFHKGKGAGKLADRFEVGDIIKMKKPHPCGSHEWEVLRVGADFRLKCMGCGHQIMVPRKLVEKNTRQITKKA